PDGGPPSGASEPAGSPEPPGRRGGIAPWFLLATLLVVVVVAFGAVIVMRRQAAPPDSDRPPIEEPLASDAGPDACPPEALDPSFPAFEGSTPPAETAGAPTDSPATSQAPASGPLGGTGSVPIVPVVSFWSTQTDESLDDLKAAFSGSGDS